MSPNKTTLIDKNTNVLSNHSSLQYHYILSWHPTFWTHSSWLFLGCLGCTNRNHVLQVSKVFKYGHYRAAISIWRTPAATCICWLASKRCYGRIVCVCESLWVLKIMQASEWTTSCDWCCKSKDMKLPMNFDHFLVF